MDLFSGWIFKFLLHLTSIPQKHSYHLSSFSVIGVSNQKKVLKADISILLSNELEESDEELDDKDDDAFLEELYR